MKFGKRILVFVIFLMSLLVIQEDVHAEVIWNTTGGLSPYGTNYDYKYWDGTSWSYAGIKGSYEDLIDVTYEVTYCYDKAYAMNLYVNEQRKLANVPEVEMKDNMMEVAMKRAAETALFWDHERPSGTGATTVSFLSSDENIGYGPSSAQKATDGFANSEGHYDNMVDARWEYAGYGCVKVNGNYYWVQVFSTANKYYEDGYDKDNPDNCKLVEWDKEPVYTHTDYTADFSTQLNPNLTVPGESGKKAVVLITDEMKLYVGQNKKANVCYRVQGSNNVYSKHTIPTDEYTPTVLTPDILSYKDGVVTGKKRGNGKIKFTLKADSSISVTAEIEVKKNAFVVDGNTYKVTDYVNRKVTLVRARTNISSVSVPNKVKISVLGRKKYVVTSIGTEAFKNNKKVKSVSVGTNVTKIGKAAFKGCKNLEKITIKTQKLQSVGKNALKGIHKKAVIKVPKKKLELYKPMLKGKGQKRSVKIQRY